MSKLLVLLYFALIVSNSICTECECDPSEHNGDDKDNYICVKSGGSCDWVLLCEHATKTAENEETFKCSDYAVTEENQENYYCGESTGTACKEIPYCVGNTEGDCTTFKVVPSKSETHVCVAVETTAGADGETPNPHCQEKYLCESVPTTEREDCEKYIVSEENKYTHRCVAVANGDHKCVEEKYKCKDVPKIQGETEIKCSDFEVDSDKKETHYCKEDTASETNQCKEEYLCSSVPRSTDGTTITCSDYPVSEINKYSHECIAIEDTTSEKACFENKYKCNDVPVPEDGTTITCSDFDDEDNFCITGTTTPCTAVKKCTKVDSTDLTTEPDCSNYRVSDSTKFVCKKHATEQKCEEIYKCEQAPKNAEGECSGFEISDEEHVCIDEVDESSNKKCKLISLCTKATKEGTSEDFDCSIFPTTVTGKVCVESKEEGKACEEIYECGNVPKAEASDCSIYPLSEKNKETHTCKPLSDSEEKGCFEEEIMCSTAEKGESNEQCSKYKVTNSAKYKCAKNPDTTKTSAPCIEKELSACEKQTSGATDDVCSKLAVEKEGEEKCVKDGDKCSLLSYCDYGAGKTDSECAIYALKDGAKNECKKKADENKCEEVEKKSETATSDGEKNSDEDDETKSDKDKSSDENKDTSNNTEAKSKNEENENGGNLINVSCCLLLIIYFLL